jgi:hypothetical protein
MTKNFKPCPGCPTPAKCKKAGKCMKKSGGMMKEKKVKRGY